MFTITPFAFNPLDENTYVLYNGAGDCIIIDPGCYFGNERRELADYISENGLHPKYLLNTHCHFDHVFGNKFVNDTWGLEPWLHPDEQPVLQNAARAGLELLAEIGIEKVRERHKLLSQRLVDGALDQGWTIRCPRDAEERTPIVTVEHPDPASAVTALRAAAVICDNRPGLIRLSPHYFNTLEEMDRALALLEPLRVAHAVA